MDLFRGVSFNSSSMLQYPKEPKQVKPIFWLHRLLVQFWEDIKTAAYYSAQYILGRGAPQNTTYMFLIYISRSHFKKKSLPKHNLYVLNIYSHLHFDGEHLEF
jgi:hypothetical protein